MGAGGPVFNMFKGILSNFQQLVLVDWNFSLFKPVVSGILQGSVLGYLLFILYTADMWNDLKNKIVFYANNTTLCTEVASLSNCINVAISLNRDLV